MNGPLSVSPEAIVAQRAAGWPDFHPEDFCHRCGRPNMCWFTDGDSWRRATATGERGELEILCPPCFAVAWSEATGVSSCWEMRPTAATLTRLVGGEP